MAKILVIDDAPRILNLLETVLLRKGHVVVLAENGRTGLKLFRRDRPHVTILDFMLPDVGGLDVLKEIRTLDPNASVIIHSGFATEERERQARELGVTDFLKKGFSLHTLGTTLDRVLKQLSDERRQFPRFWVQFPISFLQEGVMIGDGTGYDLSAGGCTVESQAAVRKGDYVALQLYLPDHQEPTIPVMVEIAVVRWAIQQKFGLEFISLPSGDQQRLRQYVTTLQTTISEGYGDRTKELLETEATADLSPVIVSATTIFALPRRHQLRIGPLPFLGLSCFVLQPFEHRIRRRILPIPPPAVFNQ